MDPGCLLAGWDYDLSSFVLMTHLRPLSPIRTGAEFDSTFLHLRRFQLQQIVCALEVSVRHKGNLFFLLSVIHGDAVKRRSDSPTFLVI